MKKHKIWKYTFLCLKRSSSHQLLDAQPVKPKHTSLPHENSLLENTCKSPNFTDFSYRVSGLCSSLGKSSFSCSSDTEWLEFPPFQELNIFTFCFFFLLVFVLFPLLVLECLGTGAGRDRQPNCCVTVEQAKECQLPLSKQMTASCQSFTVVVLLYHSLFYDAKKSWVRRLWEKTGLEGTAMGIGFTAVSKKLSGDTAWDTGKENWYNIKTYTSTGVQNK